MNDDDQWREKLSPEAYQICREKGTEPAFSGEFNEHKQAGRYLCKCCGEALFDSGHKYESGSGWPSFDRPATDQVIHYETDSSHGMQRVEVSCQACGCHLGHVFDDGPISSTGKRYCVNSLSLNFEDAIDE